MQKEAKQTLAEHWIKVSLVQRIGIFVVHMCRAYCRGYLLGRQNGLLAPSYSGTGYIGPNFLFQWLFVLYNCFYEIFLPLNWISKFEVLEKVEKISKICKIDLENHRGHGGRGQGGGGTEAGARLCLAAWTKSRQGVGGSAPKPTCAVRLDMSCTYVLRYSTVLRLFVVVMRIVYIRIVYYTI
jgi:hypothetical protein